MSSEDKAAVESASTWMQVVFGGVSVSVATAGLVIAYFAWVQPHSPDQSGEAQAKPPAKVITAGSTPAGESADGDKRKRLVDLKPESGGDAIETRGADITMACASGQSVDARKTVQYTVAGRYREMTARLSAGEKSETDSLLQIKVFADEREFAFVELIKSETRDLRVPLEKIQRLRIELTCQSPTGELIINQPIITHV